MEAIYFATALVATAGGIALFRRYGRRLGTYDVPNERSSHTTPTLRGGGIVIATVCVFLYVVLTSAGGETVSWNFVAGAVLVSVVSWIDDARDLPAWTRFAAHSAAAAILLAGTGAISGVEIPGYWAVPVDRPWAHVLSFLWIVWMINAYNFMDGIDGIAGAQAAVAGAAWAAYGIWSGDVSAYTLGGIIAFAALGFLLHNWSPASVFMGDVGSAFLGYTLAALPLLEQMNEPGKGPLLFAAAVSFVWLFIFDTAFTLVRRSLKKEKVWVAHRKHLYQRLVIAGWGHAAVSLLYAGVALLVCTAFFLALLVPGSLGRFALFIYALGPVLVLFLVLREKD